MFNYYFDVNREGHEDVVRLFEAIGAGRYEGYASTYVTDELEQAPEPKRSEMLALVEKYSITILDSTPSSEHLAELYITEGVIPSSHFFDSAHIAMAAAYGLDLVIPYNFKHIARDKTRHLTAVINREEGYDAIIICTAEEVLNHD